ncbi:MAG: exo-alpha-sialidase [Pirellulales bacterium]|nr:exo-alpha-sialidase [Pirellulales bacterium]
MSSYSFATVVGFGVLTLSVFSSVAVTGQEPVVFIEDGKPLAIVTKGGEWKRADGCLTGSGVARYLYGAREVGEGDFHIKARLRTEKRKRWSAHFVIGDGYFCFNGPPNQQVVVAGSLLGKPRLLGPSEKFIPQSAWFDFEVIRKGDQITYLVDGKKVHGCKAHAGKVGRVGFAPTGSVIQISDFSVIGKTTEISSPDRRSYSIPEIDLADQKHRQIVVDREQGQYLGHVTTVLLEDGKTMIAVYPKGHGAGGIVMKRSSDGGLTWSDRMKVPDNWAKSKEVPTIYRVVDPAGVKRLVLFSGAYPIHMAVSEDDGLTWSPLKPIGDFGGVVAMSSLVRTKDGRYMGFFHDDGNYLQRPAKLLGRCFLFTSESSDGGLTWSRPRPIASHPTAFLCEPGAIRSPDGKQIALLLREDYWRHNSFVVFSDDEGRTWSEPMELPGALTGDRHTCRYAPDGRIVVVFRDTARISSTSGDFVAWIGTYDDIVDGHEGQYRVRLMDNHKNLRKGIDYDCGYPGLEVLPDGTIAATTYGTWTEGRQPYIVSVRFKLDEIDRMAAARSKSK